MTRNQCMFSNALPQCAQEQGGLPALYRCTACRHKGVFVSPPPQLSPAVDDLVDCSQMATKIRMRTYASIVGLKQRRAR